MASILDAIGLKKLIFLCSVDYYEDLAYCGYKRECQDFQKILQLLNAGNLPGVTRSSRGF